MSIFASPNTTKFIGKWCTVNIGDKRHLIIYSVSEGAVRTACNRVVMTSALHESKAATKCFFCSMYKEDRDNAKTKEQD